MPPPQQQPHIIAPPPTRCGSCLINVCSLRLHHILIKRSLRRLLEDRKTKRSRRPLSGQGLGAIAGAPFERSDKLTHDRNVGGPTPPGTRRSVGSSPGSGRRSHSVRPGVMGPCFTGAFQRGRMIGRKTKRKQIKQRCQDFNGSN